MRPEARRSRISATTRAVSSARWSISQPTSCPWNWNRATVSGSILRIDPDTAEVSEFASLGGRPLGIEAAADGSLLVANAYTGIQRISPLGEVAELLTAMDGKPLAYADDLAVSGDGVIYFSDASTKFGALAWKGTYEASLLDILEQVSIQYIFFQL